MTNSTAESQTDYLKALPKDLAAGVVVFLVALPLCLGIALASNAPLMGGIISGVVGGLIVAWISGSHTSVSGPAAGLAAVVFAQIATLKSFEAFLVAVMLAGLIQIALGALRAGFIASFFPSSVIKGLLAAIGVLLILKQIPHVVGHDADPEGEMEFIQPDGQNTFSELFASLFDFEAGATLVGLLSLTLLLVWDRTKLKQLRVPAPLVVVLLGVGVNQALRHFGSSWAIGESHLVQVPTAASLADLFQLMPRPDFRALSNPAVYTAAFTIAIVASLETLLNLEAVDKLDSRKRTSPPNRELVAQGVGNCIAGLVGGLPLTSVIVRSSVNINAGAATRMSAFIHGVLLLLLVVLVPHWLNEIPLAALAAILLATGLKLASPALFRQMWAEGRNQFLPFIVTIVAIVLTDLLVGILIGLGISLLFILHSNFRRPLRRFMEHHVGGEVLRIELANQVSFLNRAVLEQSLNSVPTGGHVVLDARHTDYIDPDVLDLIHDFRNQTAPARGIFLSLVGFKDRYVMDDHIQYVDVSTREVQSQVDPARVLKILQEGNARFVRGERVSRDLMRQVNATAQGQFPLAVVLSCMDSRTSTELVFDLGLGDIFSIRVAGNIAVEDALASMEYGCAVAGAKLILVLGHTRCGAVKATVDIVHRQVDACQASGCDHIKSITGYIQHAVEAEHETRADRSASNEAFVDRVAKLNVLHTMEVIRRSSGTLRSLLDRRQIALVGGLYDVGTGKVEFISDPFPSRKH
ncbi:MAG: sulfate transporter [Pedosphaera sp. Tous-C6FEB]|nr:MAG: sulfate transporter [Pedosphaera sp. Tous-C6FEB]